MAVYRGVRMKNCEISFHVTLIASRNTHKLTIKDSTKELFFRTKLLESDRKRMLRLVNSRKATRIEEMSG